MKLGEAIEVLFATKLNLADLDYATGSILVPSEDASATPEYISIPAGRLSVDGSATVGNLLWTTEATTFEPGVRPAGQYRGELTLRFATAPLIQPITKTFVLHLKSSYDI